MVDSIDCKNNALSPNIFLEDNKPYLKSSDILTLNRIDFVVPERFFSSEEYLLHAESFLQKVLNISTFEEAQSIAYQFYLTLGLTPANLKNFFETFPQLQLLVLEAALHVSDELLKGYVPTNQKTGKVELSDYPIKNFICEFLAPLIQLENQGQVFVFKPGQMVFQNEGAEVSYAGQQSNLDRYPGLFQIKLGENVVDKSTARGLLNWLHEDLNRRIDAMECKNPEASHRTLVRVEDYDVEVLSALESQYIIVGEQDSYAASTSLNANAYWVSPLFRPVVKFSDETQDFRAGQYVVNGQTQFETSELILTSPSQVYQNQIVEIPLVLNNGYQTFTTSLSVEIANNINEAPEALLTRKNLSETESQFAVELSDPNPNDNEHNLQWQIYVNNELVQEFSETVTDLGQNQKVKTLYLKTPHKTYEQNVRIVATLTDVNHDHNQVAIQTYEYKVSAKSIQRLRLKNYVQKQNEINEIIRLTGAKKTSVAIDNTEEAIHHVVEAYTVGTLGDVFSADYLTLVDESGSMIANTIFVADQADSIVPQIANGLFFDSDLRLAAARYGDKKTTVDWQSLIYNLDEADLSDIIQDFDQSLESTSNLIGSAEKETLWYSLWDLMLGPNAYDFIQGEGTYRKIIVLTDPEAIKINAEENIVAIPGDNRFNKDDALIMLSEANIDIEIIDFYGNENNFYFIKRVQYLVQLLESEERLEFLHTFLSDDRFKNDRDSYRVLYDLPEDEVRAIISDLNFNLDDEAKYLIRVYQNMASPWSQSRVEDILTHQIPHNFDADVVEALIVLNPDKVFDYIVDYPSEYHEEIMKTFYNYKHIYKNNPEFLTWIENDYLSNWHSGGEIYMLFQFLDAFENNPDQLRDIYYQLYHHLDKTDLDKKHLRKIVSEYVRYHPQDFEVVSKKYKHIFEVTEFENFRTSYVILAGAREEAQAVPYLVGVLESEDSSVYEKSDAVYALTRFSSEEAQRALVSVIQNSVTHTNKYLALKALIQKNPDLAYEVAKEWCERLISESQKISETDYDSKRAIQSEIEAFAEALQFFADDHTILLTEFYLENANIFSGTTYANLAFALGNTQSEDALPLLTRLAEKSLPNSLQAQENICEAVKKIGLEEGVAILKIIGMNNNGGALQLELLLDVLKTLENLGFANQDAKEIIFHILNFGSDTLQFKAAVTAKKLGIEIDDEVIIDKLIDQYLAGS